MLIEPDVHHVLWDEFAKTPQLVAAGEAATREALPKIRAALKGRIEKRVTPERRRASVEARQALAESRAGSLTPLRGGAVPIGFSAGPAVDFPDFHAQRLAVSFTSSS